jgi:hypothetical protein
MPSHFHVESMHIGLIWSLEITPITNTNICLKYSHRPIINEEPRMVSSRYSIKFMVE